MIQSEDDTVSVPDYHLLCHGTMKMQLLFRDKY